MRASNKDKLDEDFGKLTPDPIMLILERVLYRDLLYVRNLSQLLLSLFELSVLVNVGW